MKASDLPQLFDVPPQPRARGPEPAKVYQAVMALRRRGYRVFRYGRFVHLILAPGQHLFGEQVSDRELIRRAFS